MADEELFRIRPDFVQRVPKEVIEELLDDLLAAKVLNNDEKESVILQNHSRATRARLLIDIVRNKGRLASGILIDSLKIRDASLHTSFGLASRPSAQTAVPSSSASLNFSSNTKVTQKENLRKNNTYPVTEQSIKSRMALLITNIEFDIKKMNRKGADKDEENMETLLKYWKYEVVKYRNLSGQEIDNAVREFSQHPNLSQTDSVFVIIMSHGKLGAILGIHWKKDEPDEFPIDNIYKHLNTRNCPALLNKPKVIIIQACRGENSGSVLVSDGPSDTYDRIPSLVCDTEHQVSVPGFTDDLMDDALRLAHSEKDFITVLSSTPGTVSYRHIVMGSVLIHYIFEVFNDSANEDHIEELFRKVLLSIEEHLTDSKRQMPTKDRCSLTKHFYLFPSH